MKTLAFDSWTGGASNYQHLLPAFEAKGLSLMLVHIGSWGSDPNRPARETIGGLSVRSIASYGHNSLDKLLDEEKPDAVLFLSTQTFAHRAFNRYCRQRGIPTLHLYHGLVTAQLIKGAGVDDKISLLGHAMFVAKRLYKTFRFTLPCYAGALFKTHADASEWARFFADLARLLAARQAKAAALDARTTKCCVFTAADIPHAVQTYGFDEAHVAAVGNPDLASFGLRQEMIGLREEAGEPERRHVMYIDTRLEVLGLYFTSTSQYVEHLKATAASLDRQGFKMLLRAKPHVAGYLDRMAEQLRGSGIEFVEKQDFISRLEDCAACIVEPTTLALVPALMGVPLLLAHYGLIKELGFGQALTSYPRSHLLDDIGQAAEILRQDATELDQTALQNWIAINAGPLPAEQMPERVADIMAALVAREMS